MKKLENTIGFYVRKIRDLVLDTDKIRIVHGVLEDVVSGGCVGGRMSPHTSPALFIISDWRMFMFCKCEVLMQQGKVFILAMAISIYTYIDTINIFIHNLCMYIGNITSSKDQKTEFLILGILTREWVVCLRWLWCLCWKCHHLSGPWRRGRRRGLARSSGTQC